MSAKWRALQHRHQYTYTAVIFPQSYIDKLNSLPSDTASLRLFLELKELISLNSIYAQVNLVKKVASAFGELLGSTGELVAFEASRFYLEILFIENSLPLHRTLVSVLAKCSNHQSLVASCFRLLCDEYGLLGAKGRRFLLCRVALSMMSCPKLGFLVEIVEECSISVALDAALGLQAVSREVSNGSRPSPIAMEQCQEALSCIYYLLQRFPSKFTNLMDFQGGLVPEGSSVNEIIMEAIINILKSSSFSRDSLIAAGVGFCAALQLYLTPEELGHFIVKLFFCRARIDCEFENLELKVPYKGDLHMEIGNLTVLSRLCLLRGILTAVPRTVLNNLFSLSENGINGRGVGGSCYNRVWTILFDGILPELCNCCENPIDSHFNFHVLTVLQMCLQQIKTLVAANLVNLSANYDPLPEEMGSRILRIIWDNLEDPLNQTVKQVHLIFDLFLDIQSMLSLPENSERTKYFLQKTTSDLLHLGPRCKGRYVPLASLTKRLGAKTVLNMSPNLLFQTIYAYVDDDVSCAATTFLKCFLECLRDECWNSDGVDRGYITFRGHCLPPIMYGLVSGISKLRSNLNTYALSVVLGVDVDSIFPMLDFISVGENGEDKPSCPDFAGVKTDLSVDQQVAALVSLLKVSRSLAMIEGDIEYDESSMLREADPRTENLNLYALVCVKGIKVKVLVKWLVLALTHVDETLRVDAAESLFLNPKTSSLPSHLELNLLKEAVPLNMRCCSTAFQMKWTSLFRKFFSRVRTALERQLKQGSWKLMIPSESNGLDLNKTTEGIVANRAKDLFQFMRWFSCFLFFSCYPSAPYERKIMAMELILIMINVWPVTPLSESNSTSAGALYPYNEGFTSPDSTLLLVGSIIDSWDRLRENSFRILLHFPTPLPGISSEEKVKEVVTWAKKLVCSPRVRESDAGALSLRLIFRKYVLELGWIVGASVDVVCFRSQSELLDGATQISKSRFPVIEYILSLIDWLHVAVAEGERDLSEACKNSFVHGVLLTLRYTFEELDWNSDIVFSRSSEMRNALKMLLELVQRITSLALWVVSADAWYLPDDMDDMVGEDAFLLDVPDETTLAEPSAEPQITNLRPIDTAVRPSEQVVMVGCWLAMKEVSLLLGTITRKIPLPTCTTSDTSKTGDYVSEGSDILPMAVSNEILDVKQLESIGNHFLDVLLKMKHNGAIDKTRAGFTALCNRLLCSNDPRLCKMTESWMEQLMARTVAKGQTVDDLLRRSAGIPAGFIALFLSEPDGTPKKLLPRALRWLIDVANTSLSNSMEANHQSADSGESSLTKSNHTTFCANPTDMDASEKTSKVRHEGVIPTVHAFNVLRAAFNDTNLGTDTSGFSAEALIISIRSFSSPYWEVRNSACQAYTALVRRMIGFLNVQKRESARRALTAVEFFHRYPTLHPFLFHELKVATELLGDGSSRHLESNISKVVHPSLCPVLIVLSRLKPSMIACEAEDPLDPFLFMPFIRRCSTQSNLRVRVLASRALLGLVSNEKLPSVLLDIASELPHARDRTINSVSSGSIYANNEKHTSFNSIHGTVLQLSSLLDVNCRNLVDVSKKDQILGDLIPVLKICSWIGNPKLCPCSVLNTSFLQLLGYIHGIARTCRISKHVDIIRSLLLESSSECMEAKCSPAFAFHDPTKAELRKQAVVSYFNCVFEANNEAAEEGYQILLRHPSPVPSPFEVSETGKEADGHPNRLMLLTSDSSYEVRLATLKWLLRFLKSTGAGAPTLPSAIYNIQQWAESNLQVMLMNLLAKEGHPRCLCYILRIFFTWNLLKFQEPNNQLSSETIYVGNMECNSVLQFWDRLTSLNKVARNIKVREAILCCMGVCVKRLATIFKTSILLNKEWKNITDTNKLVESENWGKIYGCICFFVELIKEHGASSEPVNMRKAAADSMVASGLLGEAAHVCSFVSNNLMPSDDESSFRPSEAANLYACRILDLWFTCITLLEDEDVGLREKLAEDVQKFFTVNGSKNYHLSAIPTQVEKVIEMSFEFLSSVFGHWLMYFDFLASCVRNTASFMVAKGDLIRRVFDKEIDNHHEEKLLICQLCCLHLEKLPVSISWGVGLTTCEITSFLQKWRSRFYHQLVSFTNDYIKAEVGVSWIGGPGNHKDVFTSLYANLLGLYALSRCLSTRKSEICESWESELTELEGLIRPFLGNPLISNLYLVVTQCHQIYGVFADSLGVKSSGNSSGWEGFNPYFLLR